MDQPTQTGLVRAIRRWDLVAFAINGTIGAGIFGLPSKVYSLTGPVSLVAYLVCALVVALIILCFAEVGSRFTETGGPYVYAREAFGPIIGFVVGWMRWLVGLTAFAANCNLLVEYLSYFWSTAHAEPWRSVIITTVVVSLTVINVMGVRSAAVVGDVFTIAKLIPMVLFIVVGLFFINPQNFSLGPRLGYQAFSTSVLLLVYAFTGFEYSGTPAGELRDPQHDLPFAILTMLAVVTLLYTLIQVVCIGTLPELAGSSRPLADAGNRILGTAGGAIISAGVLISITGNLIANMLATPRLTFAMAEQQQLPRILAATHRRFHTPHVSILLTAVAMLVLTLSGTFIQALTISAIARLVTYVATSAALPVLRRKSNVRAAAFKVPFGPIVSVAALVLAAWLLSNSTWREARDAGIAAVLGLFIFSAYRLARHREEAKD